jgi:hypothetical protein
MASFDPNRRGHVFHQDECPAAHIAAVGLQQERPLIAPGCQTGAILNNLRLRQLAAFQTGSARCGFE